MDGNLFSRILGSGQRFVGVCKVDDTERLVTGAEWLTLIAPRYAVKVSPMCMTPKLSGKIREDDRCGEDMDGACVLDS